MTDDQEVGYIVYVSAEEVKGSGKKAIKGLGKEIDDASKGKKYVVPVDISVDISDTDKKVQNAQAKVIESIKKMTAEGFSASSDDIKHLRAELTNLSKAMDNAHIGRRNGLFKIINDQVNELEKSYRAMMKTTRTGEAKVKTKNNSSDYIERKANDYQKRREAQKRRQQEEIDSAIDIHNREVQNKELAGKGPNRLGSTPPIENISRPIDAGKTSKRMMHLSDYSAHGSNWADDLARTLKEEIGKAAESLITEIYKTAEEMDSAIKEKHKNDKEQDAKIQGVGANSRATTEKEFLDDIFNKALKEFKSLLIRQEKGDTSLSEQDYIDQLSILKVINDKRGKDLEETYNSVKSALLSPYSDPEGDSQGRGRKKLGGIDAEEGTIKGEGEGHALATETIKKVYNFMDQLWEATNPLEAMAKRFYQASQEANSTSAKAEKKKRGRPRKNSQYEEYTSEVSKSDSAKAIQDLANKVQQSGEKTTQELAKTTKAADNTAKATENQISYDKIEHDAERVADSAAGKKTETLIKDTEQDSDTGFDTDAKANEAIKAIKDQKVLSNLAINLKDMMSPCETILQSILNEVQNITKNGINSKSKKTTKSKSNALQTIPNITKALVPVQENIQKALIPIAGTFKNYYDGRDIAEQHRKQRRKEREQEVEGDVSRSTITTTKKNPHSTFTKLLDGFEKLTGVTANYRVIMAKTSEEQDRMNADRINQFGLNRGRNTTDSGDKISFARSMSLWRGKDKFGDLFKDLNLSEGVTVDTTDITDKLAKVLSGKEMFKAQTGGWMSNIMGAMTGGLSFMVTPSIEKSRAQAEGVNQIMANIREAANDILQDIQAKESSLSGMKQSGELKFSTDGAVDFKNSSNEAKTLLAQLEESKQVLASILGDVGMVDQVVGRSGGKISRIIKQLGFTSPVLRQNNSILANINAGLDKGGKALKFQTRMGEILNYSFQLMGRHVGQIFKNLLMLANPFNLIKRMFSDFMSYDVKWQRTMNVIKYNLRRIIRPFMEWLAQQLVNILGIVNAIIKGIGQAFGQSWDLFDQSAANAEQMREELEQAANVTASFDELHDIGTESSNNPAEDLMGDIYRPEWGDLYDAITKKARELTEFLIPIFKKLGEILKWCLDHWKELLAAFLAFKIAKALWDLLKWAGALKDVFGAISKIGFSNLLLGLLGILGVIQTIKGIWDAIDWAKNWGGMLPDEREEKGDKAIRETETGAAAIGASIGGLIGGSVGGLPGKLAGMVIGATIGDGMGEAAIGTFNTVISAWHGDERGTKHNAEKAGEGIGKTLGAAAGTAGGVAGAAAIGAALGTTVGPIGTAVGAALGAVIGWAIGGPIGKAVGSAFGDLVTNIQKLTRGSGEFQRLQVTAEDVQNAMQLAADKTAEYEKALSDLNEMEQRTGENGKELYEAIENGTKSYWGLTDAQREVYDQYKYVLEAEKEMIEAKKQSLEYSAKQEEQLAKETGDYKKYLAVLQDGVDQGIMSHDEMYDHLAQTYGSLDATAKEVFIDNLPAYMRQSVKDQGAEYETFGNNIATIFNNFGQRLLENNQSILNSITEGWEKGGLGGAIEGLFKGIDNAKFAESTNTLKLLQATEEDLQHSTEALTEAQRRQAEIQSEVDELQRVTSESAQELYDQVNNGSVKFSDLTENEQLLVNKYAELQEAMETTNTVAQNHTTVLADLDLQAATTSGNYDTFISNLMAANERGEISTDEMYNLMSQAYADMDNDARTSFGNQASEYGLLVEDIRSGSTEYLGILGDLQIGAEDTWNGITSWIGTKSQEIWDTVSTKFGEVQTTASQIWENVKTSAAITWEDMKNSAIGQKAQEIWTNVTDTFENVKTTLGQKWEDIKSTASNTWEDIKNSAIGQKVQEIWTNVTDTFGRLGSAISGIWDGIVNGVSTAWQNICDTIGGWLDSIWNAVTGVFNGIVNAAQETWQRVCNFFSGKGFKTNEQVNGGSNQVSIQPYATGTNYVPMDGLAYLHQGEAVIPAKYNQPYTPENTGLENAIYSLSRQVEQISNKVNEGISVNGQFVQRGSDLVATVQKANNKISNNILNNKVYAR